MYTYTHVFVCTVFIHKHIYTLHIYVVYIGNVLSSIPMCTDKAAFTVRNHILCYLLYVA